MKKWSIALFALAAAFTGTAQDTGMHFEHNTTWEKVLAKAKAENKYIFVDCFTTWCGPCKMMSKTIFPMEPVGKFYNANYIIVKVQLDTLKDKETGKVLDNEEVQSWYATGDKMEADYNINAYPTYLFFDPNGTIVHRAVGSSDADVFISKGKDAMVPEKQYYTLKHRYETGKKDEKSLYTLAKAANEAYDKPFSKKVTDEYLATQTDLLTKENITFLADNIRSSKDKGFTELLNHPEAFNKILGSSYATNTLRSIILREEVLPVILPAGQKQTAVPDWGAALKAASAKYPKQAPEAVAYYKISYYQRKKDWVNFGTAVADCMKAYGSDATPEQMNEIAWTIFENCDDIACINNAIKWSRQSFAQNNSHMFMDTYANLLYKAGKKDEAVQWENKAMALAKENKEDTSDYQTTLDKMTKGEKTW